MASLDHFKHLRRQATGRYTRPIGDVGDGDNNDDSLTLSRPQTRPFLVTGESLAVRPIANS